MPEYTCFRCRDYTTPKKCNMYNHLIKINKCKYNENHIKPTIDDYIKNSLVFEEDWNFFHKNNINHNCTKTSNEFIDELKDLYITKRTNCNYCNKKFNNYKHLENHIFICIKINIFLNVSNIFYLFIINY